MATIQSVKAKTATIYRCIDSTTYKVRIHFNKTAKKTMNYKICYLTSANLTCLFRSLHQRNWRNRRSRGNPPGV